MIYIALEGGIVQSVCTDEPDMIGKRIVLVDYDTEGADESELTCVKQPDGELVLAFVQPITITEAQIIVPEMAAA